MRKKVLIITSTLLAVLLLMSALPVTGLAAEISNESVGATSGKNGDCTWSLANGVLTITGPGKMSSWYSVYTPWSDSSGQHVKSVIIKDGVTEINGFAYCSELKSVSIPKSVKTIGEYAFRDCTALESITIPGTVSTIKTGAFINTGLKSIKIPYGVTTIENAAFACCNNLTQVSIADSVTKMGNAFYECRKLTSLTIPDSVTDIYGQYFVGNCTSLVNITLPRSLDTLSRTMFQGCKSLKNYTVPNHIKKIEEYAFCYCTGLESITIPNSVTSIGTKVFEGVTNLIIYGTSGSEAERYAKAAGYSFISNSGADINRFDGYYSTFGKPGISARSKEGLSVSGCTVEVNGNRYTMNSLTYYVDIPDGYTGNVTVSKSGYLSSTLPAECLKKYNFFVMYPNTEKDPIVQHLLLRNTKNRSDAYTDLLRSEERIYDLGNKTYDLYVGYNANGKTVSSVYLMQGSTKMSLQKGMNRSLAINSVFKSDGGKIYLCIQTNDGKIYKKDSNITALREHITVDADLGKAISGTVDESLTGMGGWDFTGKFKLGKLPVSINIQKNGHVKGTIGIQGDESYTNTWYEGIKKTITKHESMGKTEYSNEDMEVLEKFLKDSGADVTDGYFSLGFEVTGSIIGCFEGDYNALEGKMENVKLSMILKVSGEGKYTQQSVFVGAFGIPIPYYWTVSLGLELSAKIGGSFSYNENHNLQFKLEMPSLTIEPSISGSLCLGMNKIIGGGGKLSGSLSITFNGPDYSMKNSEWKLSYKVALTGQLAGFSGDLKLKDGDFVIYPNNKKSSTTVGCAENITEQFIGSSKHIDAVGSSATGQDENEVVSLNYGFANPKIATLSDGTAVMVWVDYDTQRSVANQAALFYSVFNKETGEWSAPNQVDNDGTADDLPVLKTFDDTVYLVWNNADEALGEDAEMVDMLNSMGVSYAVFNGTAFDSVSHVTSANGYMDICPDFTVINGTPTVIWLKNEEGDLFGQSGTNQIIQATLENDEWTENDNTIVNGAVNSFCIINEHSQPVVYYSADINDNSETLNAFDIFRYDGITTEQITETDEPETDICAYDNTVYWNSSGLIKGSDGFEATGVQDGETYLITNLGNGKKAIIFTTYSEDKQVSYVLKYQTDAGLSEPITLVSGVSSSGGMAAFWNNNALHFITDEITENNDAAALKQYCFNNTAKPVIYNATYNPYTLIAGDSFHATAFVRNDGFVAAGQYTVYAYNGSTLLGSTQIETPLLPGKTDSVDLYFDLPETVDFDEISLYVAEGNTAISGTSPYALLFSPFDISVEDLSTVLDGEICEVSASIVNRGINTIANATVEVRSNSVDGTIIDSFTVSNLQSREGRMYTHDFTNEQLTDVNRIYLVVSPIQGEENVVNNEEYSVIQIYSDNITEEINIEDLYDSMELDKPYQVSIDEEDASMTMLFIPEETRMYVFTSTSREPIIGYLMDSNENILSTFESDFSEEFKLDYTLQAGTPYLFKTKFKYEFLTGDYSITVKEYSPLGDTNLDGIINIRDVTAIQRHLVELDIFDDEQIALADTNGDGEINIADATHLQMYLAQYEGIVLRKQN